MTNRVVRPGFSRPVRFPAARAAARRGAAWRIATLTLALLLSGADTRADEQPAAAQPAAAPAANPPAEAPALKFARHDAVRRAERAKALADAAAQANGALEAANKGVADAKAALAGAEKALADAAAAITVAEQARTAADKAVAEAQENFKKTEAEKKDDQEAINAAKAAAEAAQKNAEVAARQLVEVVEKKKQAEAAKATAVKKVPEVEAGVKPAADAKAAADKASGEAQSQSKLAGQRVAAFEKETPKPDPAATRLVQTITHDRPVITCQFDPAGDFLFAGAQDNSFHRWDIFTGSVVHAEGHKSWLASMVLIPGPARQAVTAGYEGKLIWWNAFDPVPAALRAIDAHKGYIRAVAVSPDGKLLATGGNDTLVRVWSAADGALVKELAGHPRHVYNVAFDPTGKFLLSGDLLGVIKQWEVGSWAMTRELDAKVLWKFDNGFKADVGGIRSLDFSPDGKLLAAGGITDVSNAFAGVGSPAVVLFDWESGKQIKLLKPKDKFQGSIYGVRFHPSGEFLIGAGGGGAGAMWFWKPADENSFHVLALPSTAYDLALHPDGFRLAVPLFDKTIRIYDFAPKFEVAAK